MFYGECIVSLREQRKNDNNDNKTYRKYKRAKIALTKKKSFVTYQILVVAAERDVLSRL